jgi:hypothetical protein
MDHLLLPVPTTTTRTRTAIAASLIKSGIGFIETTATTSPPFLAVLRVTTGRPTGYP